MVITSAAQACCRLNAHENESDIHGIAGQPTDADATKVDSSTTYANESSVHSGGPERAPLTTGGIQAETAQQPQVP